MASGTVLRLMALRRFGNVIQCLIPGNRFEFAATLATDHGVFRRGVRIWGIVNEVPARKTLQTQGTPGWFSLRCLRPDDLPLSTTRLIFNLMRRWANRDDFFHRSCPA